MPLQQGVPALDRLLRLAPGRHYGASSDSGCWVMVGRDFQELSNWSIVPPAASVTFAWGNGGCSLEFDGGRLQMRPGDWMWIDAGFVHRGENLPGSDFLTVFFPETHLVAAGLDRVSIGAVADEAPSEIRDVLMDLAILLLEGSPTRLVEAPILDAILESVRARLAVVEPAASIDEPVSRAASVLRQGHTNDIRISDVAKAVGLTGPEFSRRFRQRYRVTPKVYRKQLRLAWATRALTKGGSVTAAAHAAGFSDSAHFSRTFVAQYRITPSTWARKFVQAAAVSDR